jgi:hypothetical protein
VRAAAGPDNRELARQVRSFVPLKMRVVLVSFEKFGTLRSGRSFFSRYELDTLQEAP